MSSNRFDRWAPTYDDSALQPAYRAAHEAVLRLVGNLARPMRVLDVGCGTGQLLASAAAVLPTGTTLVGLDTSAGMLRAASDRGVGHWIRAAAEGLPFADAVFDAVVATASLRHWVCPARGLGEVRRVLVDGGIAVVADLIPQGRPALRDAMVAAGLNVVAATQVDGYGPVAIIEVVVGHRRVRRRPAWRRRHPARSRREPALSGEGSAC